LSQNPSRTSFLDKEPYLSFVTECIKAGDMNTTIVAKLYKEYEFSTSRDSIFRFRNRHGIQIPGVEKSYTKLTGDNAVAQTTPRAFIRDMHERPILDDPDAMMEERGLDPAKWYIDGITVNQWDGPQSDGNIVTYYQAKFTAKKRHPELILHPVRTEGKIFARPAGIKVSGQPELVVICGDQQAPFHDRHLHELFCQWLESNKPDRGINLGDLMDFPDISRHPDDPTNVADAQECLQVGYDIHYDYVESSPSTEWDWMPGNHDWRLRDYLIKNAPRVAQLRRVDTPEVAGEVVHAIDFLLRTDELGINFIDPKGPYDLAQVNLSQNLAVRHGWIVRPKGGDSAYKSLEKTGYSILVGHTHRQAIVQHTVPEIDGRPRQLLAAEIGCMCRLDARNERDTGGRIFPSYTPMADWQRGFATAQIYEDGKFKVDLASYVNGVLLWQGQRYE
jgi:hypothetical protein